MVLELCWEQQSKRPWMEEGCKTGHRHAIAATPEAEWSTFLVILLCWDEGEEEEDAMH